MNIDDSTLRLSAAWKCHNCNKTYYFEYDEETKLQIIKKLEEYGIKINQA